jgi:ADP-ribose pyrophosphatase YjhB (NUDIX family)
VAGFIRTRFVSLDMGIAERSRARVEDLLADLERGYDSFPVNQTTLTLPADRFDRARREYGDGTVDTYVRIANDDGEVLSLVDEGAQDLPGAVWHPNEAVEGDLERTVAAETGVDFSIEGLSEVTIAGLSNADADEGEEATLYRLLVVFEASYEEGEPVEGVEWQAEAADPSPAFV